MEFSKDNNDNEARSTTSEYDNSNSTKVQKVKKRSLYNFSKVSSRDNIVYAACRPGHTHPREGLLVTPRGQPTTTEAVKEWVEHMKSHQIKRVLCLLTRSELTFYSKSLLSSYRKLFNNDNCVETVADIYSKDARKRILDALLEAEKAGERIVIHCSAGQSRTGACCALWLHHRYKLAVDVAINEINSYASESNVFRQASSDSLLKMLVLETPRVSSAGSKSGNNNNSNKNDNSTSNIRKGLGEPKSAIAPHTPRYNIDTPRSSRPLPKTIIAFVQMGGTIDKDYPKSTNGYAFEIGESASKQLLQTIAHVPLNIKSEFYECCKKDSTEITKDDLSLLSKLLGKINSRKIIITHGSDTIISTASYLGKISSLAKEKVIVLTCSMRPYKFTNSDAGFNIGTAVGAVNCLTPGVYIAMGGCIFSHDRCVRDVRSGAFYAVP